MGNTVLSSANAPLLAQNILDSRAVDVLECSIFLPKLQNDPLETTKSGKKIGGFKSSAAVGKRIKEPQMAFSNYTGAGRCTVLDFFIKKYFQFYDAVP